MSYNPQNPNGQATAANSAPVVLASNQPAVAVSAAQGTTPWEVLQTDTTADGSITTRNLSPYGEATDGSAVEIAIDGQGTVTIQVTGTYTGSLSPQVTTDGTTWVTQSTPTLQSMSDGTYSTTIVSGYTGIWQIEVNGHAKFRMTALGAVTGSASLTMRAAAGTSQISSPQLSTTNTVLNTIAANTSGLNNTVGTAGSAVPSKLVQIGGSDGTNARAIKTNTSGQTDIRPLTSADQVTPVGGFTPSGSSGTTPVAMTTAATDYTIVPALSTRQFLLIQNNSAAPMYVNFGSAAYSGGNYYGIQIGVGQTLTLDSRTPVSAIHAASTVNAPSYYVLEG